ncbi:MAG: restriction endonuclease subunit S [Planctomycetaceae bacterium]|nr:restriction endonuclease subunit S [Planctomycetaceae bacterium]
MSHSHGNGFQQVAISDFCETGSGGTPSRAKASLYFGGSIPWVKSGELRESVITRTEETITEAGLNESAAKLLPRNTLLVALYGATVGRIGVLGIEAATNQAVCHIIPNEQRADRTYLFYALQSQVPFWLSKRVGGGQPNISQGIIKDTKIPLPYPADPVRSMREQKRIAAILDKADVLRRKWQQAISFTDDLSNSLYASYSKRANLRPRTISELLSSRVLLAHKDGNFGSSYPRSHEFGAEGIPFLSAKHVAENGTILTVDVPRLNEEKSRTLPFGWIESGDVLLSHNATVGRVGLYRGEYSEALIGTSLTCFRPNTEKLASEFLFAALRAPYFQRQLEQQMKQTTRNQVPITAQRRLSLVIPPLAIQEDFGRQSRVIHKLRENHVAAADVSNELFTSLVQRAFRGDL